MVDLIAEEPKGAFPTGCLGAYAPDFDHLERYLDLAENGRERDYLDAVIAKPRRQAELAAAWPSREAA